jgi:hypothetical protein
MNTVETIKENQSYAEFLRQHNEEAIGAALGTLASNSSVEERNVSLSFLETNQKILTKNELALIYANVDEDALVTGFPDLYDRIIKQAGHQQASKPTSVLANRIGGAFPIDNPNLGKRSFNVGLHVDELAKLPISKEGNVKLEIRSFFNHQTGQPFFVVREPNSEHSEQDLRFIASTIAINKENLLKNARLSTGQKYIHFTLTEDKGGQATAYISATSKQHVELYREATATFFDANPAMVPSGKEIMAKYKELLKEAGLSQNQILGRGSKGEAWSFGSRVGLPSKSSSHDEQKLSKPKPSFKIKM